MSDSIHKWARRELAGIKLNGNDLDARHLRALSRVAAVLAEDALDAEEQAAQMTCGCCPTCEALPGHQHPPKGSWHQHAHTYADRP